MLDSQVAQEDDITIQIHHQDYILSQHQQDDAMLDPQVPRQQDNIILPPQFLEQQYHRQQNYEQQRDINIIFILTYSFLQLDIEYELQNKELRRQEKLRHQQNIDGALTCCMCICQMLALAGQIKK